MNAANALFFALLGTVMELLPVVFPSWFRRGDVDEGSVRAIWLALMGGVQIAIGVGYMIFAFVAPLVSRLGSSTRTAAGSLALPAPRGVNVR